MKQQKMKFMEAFSFVKKRRAVINPNSGFRQQMIQYEIQLGKVPPGTESTS
jgi:hypothetical protein